MEFIGYVVAETQRAVLFHDHYWENPDWMPKSQVTFHRSDDTPEVVIKASQWICGQKKIQEFAHRDATQGVTPDE